MKTVQFKKILKESIESNADSIFSDKKEIIPERQTLSDRDFIISKLTQAARDIQTICSELNIINLFKAIKYYIINSSLRDGDTSFSSELLSNRFETLVINIIETSIKESSITKLFEDLFKVISNSAVFTDPSNYIDSLIKAAEKQKLLGLKKLLTAIDSSSNKVSSQLSANIKKIIAKEKEEGLGSSSACVPFSRTSRTSAQKPNDAKTAKTAKKDKTDEEDPALGKQGLNQFRLELIKIKEMRPFVQSIIKALILDIPESKRKAMMARLPTGYTQRLRRMTEIEQYDVGQYSNDEDSDSEDISKEPKKASKTTSLMLIPNATNIIDLLIRIKEEKNQIAKHVFWFIERFLKRNGMIFKRLDLNIFYGRQLAPKEKEKKQYEIKYLKLKPDSKKNSYTMLREENQARITNETNRDISDLTEMLESFYPFAKERLKYDRDPEMVFKSDPENGKRALGKTAHYEPGNMTVTVYIDNRHPKDIMRSLSHELVHHTQNCDGQFDNISKIGEDYAQNDEHLRIMEEDAYLRGNMCFRDWEDKYKQTNRAFGNALQENRERLYYELMRRFK